MNHTQLTTLLKQVWSDHVTLDGAMYRVLKLDLDDLERRIGDALKKLTKL